MPQISVIVPVYKVEKYLHECVDSILAQTFRDFELILVDDGSPDNCGRICDEYAAKDSRIRVIHQENHGLSGARNSGIDIARGEYITFVDSDDVVNVHYLEVLLSGMDEDTDIVSCKYSSFQTGNVQDINCDIVSISYKGWTSQEAVISGFRDNLGVTVNACFKLFRTTVIGNHRFPVGRIHEDQAFTPIVCYNSRKIITCNAVLYYYRVNPDGITHQAFFQQRYDDLWALDYCCRYFLKRDEQEIVQTIENKRSYRIASYSILARRNKVTVPAEYRISLLKALWQLRKMTDDNYFQYYLAQIHPKLPILHAYWVKIKKILHIAK